MSAIMQRAISGLTYQYARFAGQIEMLRIEERKLNRIIAAAEKIIARHTSALAENEENVKAILAKMEAINKGAVTAFITDISQTKPRKTWPKAHFGSWGAMTRAILRHLAHADGCPLTTTDLAHALNVELNLNLDADGVADLKEAVRYRLKALRLRGSVRRISAARKFAEHSTWVIADFAE